MTKLPQRNDRENFARHRAHAGREALESPPSGREGVSFTGEFVIPGETPDYLWMPHFERYRFALGSASGKRVLDVACGSGYGSDYLAQRGAASVVGGDISHEALGHARQRYARPNLSFVKLNGNRMPFRPSTFDLIISFETVEHVQDQDGFLRECSRLLRPEGELLCSTPMRLAWRPPWVPSPLNPFHTREFSFSELRVALVKHFTHVEFFGQESPRPLELLQRYFAFSSALLLSLAPGTQPLSGRTRDFLLGLKPLGNRTRPSRTKGIFEVRPLRSTWPGFPGTIIARARRGP